MSETSASPPRKSVALLVYLQIMDTRSQPARGGTDDGKSLSTIVLVRKRNLLLLYYPNRLRFLLRSVRLFARMFVVVSECELTHFDTYVTNKANDSISLDSSER